MNKYIIFHVIIILGISTPLYCQNLEWVYRMGGAEADQGLAVHVNQDQSVVDVSGFYSDASYGPGEILSSYGGQDLMLRKSSAFGIRQWVKQIGSVGHDMAYDVISNPLGEIFIAGTFEGTLQLDTTVILSTSQLVAGFILKFNAGGQLMWARKWDGTSFIKPKSLALSSSNTLVVVGEFEGQVNFGSSPIEYNLASQGANDVFVLKMDGFNGTTEWAYSIKGDDVEIVSQVATDTQDNIYITGNFRAAMDVDMGLDTFVVTPIGGTDAFLVKYDKNGSYEWSTVLGQAGLDYGNAVEVDPSGAVIVGGRYRDSIPSSQLQGLPSLISQGESDGFVIKYDNNGQITWTYSVGAQSNDEVSCIKANANNVLFISGGFRNQVDFDPHPSISRTSSAVGGLDICYIVLNQDGTYNDHFTFGGIANDVINDIDLKPGSEFVAVGSFGAIADFDPSSTVTNIFSSGGIDGFLVDYFMCINPYIKTLIADNNFKCFGDTVKLKIEEGYLNGATQWSWQRNDCESITFASGDSLFLPILMSQTFYVKGWGGCVFNDECKTITINLFEDTLVYQKINLCGGDTLFVGNNFYYTNGVYVDSLVSSTGCDSIVVSEIETFNEFSINQSLEICSGDTVWVGPNALTLPGNYVNILQTQAGCDSIVFTNLTVLPSIIENADIQICNGDSVTIRNITYFESGTYIQTSVNPDGCEDLLIINITELESNFQNVVSLCVGDSLYIGNSVYFEEGIYVDSLISEFGCDSVITSIVTLNPIYALEQEIDLCFGDSLLVGNNVYTSTGIYTDTLETASGCDSIVVSMVRAFDLIPPVTAKVDICEGDTIYVGDKAYTMTGTYIDTLQSRFGCDSIIQTFLSVSQRTYDLFVTLCEGDSIDVGGLNFTKEGIYQIDLTNSNGCDSIILLHVEISSKFNIVNSFNICPGDTVFVADTFYTLPGMYIDSFLTVTGCDSIFTTVLLENTTRDTISLNGCEGRGVFFGQYVFDEAGVFSDTLTSMAGCDSIFVFDVDLYPNFILDTSYVICKGESLIVGPNEYFSPGFYTAVLPTIYGCDSIVSFTLGVVDYDAVVFNIADTLITFVSEGALVQWYHCSMDTVRIDGANEVRFVVPESGSYLVTHEVNGCLFYSSCIDVIKSHTSSSISVKRITMYPNPAHDIIQCTIQNNTLNAFTIASAEGRKIMTGTIYEGYNAIDIVQLPSGIYSITFTGEDEIYSSYFVKL